MLPALTYHELKALEPCRDDFARVTKFDGRRRRNGAARKSARRKPERQARHSMTSFGLRRVMAKKNKDVERRIRLWLADCACARAAHRTEAQYKEQIIVRAMPS